MRRCQFLVSAFLIAASAWVALLPAAGAAVPASFPAPLAARIPADAAVYFGWAGPVTQWPGYQSSNLRTVLSHTHIADFIQGNLPVLLHRFNQLPAARGNQLRMAQFKKVIALGSLLLTHPFAIYFRPISTGIRHVAALPQVVLMMNAGKYPDAVLAIFKKLPHTLYPGGPRVTVGKAGSIVYAAIHVTPGVMRALKKQGETLSSARRFRRAMRFMPEHPMAAEYANLTRLRQYINSLLTIALQHSLPETSPAGRQQRLIIDNAKIILNGASIRHDTAFASADGFAGPQWIDASFLAMRHVKVKKMPGAAAMLALAPEHSPAVTVSHLNLGQFVSTIKTYIEASSPRVRRKVRQAIAMVNGITGVDVQRDLINAFGPYWLTYQSPAMPMNSALGEVMVNHPAHPQRLNRALQTLTPMALLAVNAAMRQRGYTGPAAQFKILHADGAVIYYIKAGGVMPAWTIANGYFYLAAYPRPIQLALQRKSGEKSILDNSKFIALLKELGCRRNYTNAAFVDQPRLLPGSYNLITTQLAAYSLLLGLQFNPPIGALMPRLSDLEKATTTSGTVTWTDSAGWHSRSISGYPGSGMFVP
jgi:hypothetical protein